MKPVHIKIFPAALALFTTVSGTSLAQGIALEKGPFQERVSEYSKVSGDIVMGVMLTGDEASTREPSIVTGVAPDWTESSAASPVCVRIVTKDGRYEAENTYLIAPSYAGTRAPFPYEGQQADLLAERSAVALVKAGRCGDRSDTFIPVHWKAEPGAQPKTLHVYVNSAGNPVSIAWGRGADAIRNCANVTELAGLKYTARCDVQIDELPSEATVRLTLFVVRSNSEEVFDIRILPVFARG
ncbi:hypothetical protein SAMN04488105_13610 [Salipiger thiooxidans]|uniref:Uncharacterized protein n=1 Tax=Salipiger thiooxidans TaxID=282683 RepID=A0A1G7MIQ5_9RHOB|nr:hypothetical protein [Salipiger thiooxidans]SDF61564.1 hypothetical protein SAMN04488105_13610 [Salipiger thiooxidans]